MERRSPVKFPTLILCLAAAAAPVGAEIIPGQAVSWTDFSHVTCINVGTDFAYFGTTDGILRYHRIENKWYDPITVSDGLKGGVIRRLAVSFNDEDITVDTDGGIYTYEKGLHDWLLDTEFPRENYRNSQPVLPLPQLFVPFGYQMFPDGYIEDNYFRRYQVTAWLDDYFNAIFVGLWGLGPARVDSRNLELELKPFGLLQKRTDAIYIEGDSIWLAGNAGDRPPEYRDYRLGVTLFDRGRYEFSCYEPRYITGFDSEIIYDIAGDEKNIYFAGRLGLTVLVRKDNRFFTLARRDGLPESETTALAVSPDSVWIGTAQGLALYTPSVDTLFIVGRSLLGGLFITDLELVSDRLIIGTDKGAHYINLKTRKIGRLNDPHGDLAGSIRSISGHGREFIVASDRGVTVVDLDTEKANPVPYIVGRGAYAAALNDRYFAAAVDEGLILIERETGRRRVFTELDGLLSTDINAIVVEGDYLWLGSDEGLTRFRWVNPDRVD